MKTNASDETIPLSSSSFAAEHPHAPSVVFFFIMLASSLLFHGYFATIGWNNPIYDHHGFRQTTTAISIFHMIKDGLRVAYPLPIFGAPWSIPLEFPVYQWIVALLAKWTGVSLEQVGRTVSLVSFYLCLLPLYSILSFFVKNVGRRLVVLCLFLASPVYIFWPRTVMIETTALLFSLWFVALCVGVLRKQETGWRLWLACLVGTIAGLAKVTTFLVSCTGVGLLLLVCWSQPPEMRWNQQKRLRQIVYLVLMFVIPLLVSYVWAKYADSLKTQNPITRDFLNFNFYKTWLFGTWSQKWQLSTWYPRLFGYVVQTTGSLWLLIVLVASLTTGFWFQRYLDDSEVRSYWWLSLGCFVTYLSGPLVFTHVYMLHDYYQTAAGVFLLLALGFQILMALSWIKGQKLMAYAVVPLLLFSLFLQYTENQYYKIQQWKGYAEHPSIAVVKKVLPPDSVLLIYGMDHDPSFAYYSTRRALMDPKDRSIHSPVLQESIQKTGRHLIRAMMVMGQERRQNPSFLQERVQFFDFHPQPLFRGAGVDMYVTRKIWSQFVVGIPRKNKGKSQ